MAYFVCAGGSESPFLRTGGRYSAIWARAFPAHFTIT